MSAIKSLTARELSQHVRRQATAAPSAAQRELLTEAADRLAAFADMTEAPTPANDDGHIARSFMLSGAPDKIVAGELITPEDWFAFGRACATQHGWTLVVRNDTFTNKPGVWAKKDGTLIHIEDLP